MYLCTVVDDGIVAVSRSISWSFCLRFTLPQGLIADDIRFGSLRIGVMNDKPCEICPEMRLLRADLLIFETPNSS